MRVKICGITNLDDALTAARCGADFVGLILAPSPRRVSVEQARVIAAALPPAVQPVLVGRNAPLAETLAALEAVGRAWVQLHGDEPVEYVADLLRQRPQTPVVKAWTVTSADSANELAAYLQQARAAGVRLEAVLLDTPKNEPHPRYDRMAEVAARCADRPPEVWLAGRLTPDNVATAVVGGRFDAVDVASGVELRPGVKSHAAIERFVSVAKGL